MLAKLESQSDLALLIGRLFYSSLFLLYGYFKVTAFSGTATYMAAKGLPVIAVVTSTGTNAFVIGDVAKQARYYAQTLFLAEKYGLPLPAALARFTDPEEASGTAEETA